MTSPVINPKIESSWREALAEEFKKPYFAQLKKFLQEEKMRYVVFPPGKSIFSAFDLCPFSKTRVVILGQDPYHGVGQAHGLAFSVNKGVQLPPSLQNIFKELHQDLGLPIPSHGDLTHWAKQGVLLLNTSLTVRAHAANSHQNKGWEHFTNAVIKVLNEQSPHSICFILWGTPAKQKRLLIDEKRHLVLTAVHPSPLSAHRGFLGCRHFSQVNAWLQARGEMPIDWALD